MPPFARLAANLPDSQQNVCWIKPTKLVVNSEQIRYNFYIIIRFIKLRMGVFR